MRAFLSLPLSVYWGSGLPVGNGTPASSHPILPGPPPSIPLSMGLALDTASPPPASPVNIVTHGSHSATSLLMQSELPCYQLDYSLIFKVLHQRGFSFIHFYPSPEEELFPPGIEVPSSSSARLSVFLTWLSPSGSLPPPRVYISLRI